MNGVILYARHLGCALFQAQGQRDHCEEAQSSESRDQSEHDHLPVQHHVLRSSQKADTKYRNRFGLVSHAPPVRLGRSRTAFAPLHSITSSARATSVEGGSRPSALAVLKLSTI